MGLQFPHEHGSHLTIYIVPWQAVTDTESKEDLVLLTSKDIVDEILMELQGRDLIAALLWFGHFESIDCWLGHTI